MEPEHDSSRVNRRSFIMSGASLAAGATLIAADKASAHHATEDGPTNMFVGTVAAKPSGDAVDCIGYGTSDHVLVRALPDATVVVNRSGQVGQLSDLSTGQTILAMSTPDAAAKADQTGELPAGRIIPCIIGKRSDVRR